MPPLWLPGTKAYLPVEGCACNRDSLRRPGVGGRRDPNGCGPAGSVDLETEVGLRATRNQDLGRDDKGPGSAGRLWILWQDLDAPGAPLEAFEDTLVAAEHRRSRRLQDPAGRRRWVTARGSLRRLLGRWSGADPREVPLRTSPGGKPFVPGGPAFNVSHSGRHLLVGVTARGRIGVDVEVVRPVDDLVPLVRRFFGPAEASTVLSRSDAFPARARTRAFFRTWVHKEAFVKGVGLGVAAWNAFEVDLRMPASESLRWCRLPEESAAAWKVAPVPTPEGLEAAVAWDAPEVVPASVPWLDACPSIPGIRP